jgi:hypothetical protein
VAIVASRSTSAVVPAGGLRQCLAEAAAQDLADERHGLLRDGLATAARPAQESPHCFVKGHQRLRLTARSAGVHDRADAFERQQLPEERPQQHRSALTGERGQRAGEHAEQIRHGVALDCHLIDSLEHRERHRHLVEVLTDSSVEIDDLGLGDDVELATAPAQERDMSDEIEAAAELGLGLADAFGDGPHLAVLGRDEGDDAVRLSEAHRPQHHAFVPKRRHSCQDTAQLPVLRGSFAAARTNRADARHEDGRRQAEMAQRPWRPCSLPPKKMRATPTTRTTRRVRASGSPSAARNTRKPRKIKPSTTPEITPM